MKIIDICRNNKRYRRIIENVEEEITETMLGGTYEAVGELTYENLSATVLCSPLIYYHKHGFTKIVIRSFAIKPNINFF
jgi:hypothetical protein